MEKCKCGLAWELTQHNVEVSYRGLIRCLCERPLMAWDGPFFYTVKRADQDSPEVADPVPELLIPARERPQKLW
jgi:hypothetical protein